MNNLAINLYRSRGVQDLFNEKTINSFLNKLEQSNLNLSVFENQIDYEYLICLEQSCQNNEELQKRIQKIKNRISNNYIERYKLRKLYFPKPDLQ